MNKILYPALISQYSLSQPFNVQINLEIINRKRFYVRNSKIYTVSESSERCLKSWMLGNTEGNNQYFTEDLYPYIFVGFVLFSATEVYPSIANTGEQQ